MPQSKARIVVVGAGVAGCAGALMLRRHAPQIEVILVEADDYRRPRLGESLPPMALALLKQLDLRPLDPRSLPEALGAAGITRPSHGVEIRWGTDRPHFDCYLNAARGPGLHLDRRRFDAWLADGCERRGIRLLRRRRLRKVVEDCGRWRLQLEATDDSRAGPRSLTCDLLIDAAGRSAPVARRLGAQRLASDQLVAVAQYFGPAPRPEDPRLTVEAFEHGWWYAAGLPDGRLVAVCLTDADLVRDLDLRTEVGRRAALPQALARRLLDRRPEGPPVTRSAACGRLDRAAGFSRGAPPDGGPPWLAVGDAASTFDPLSSQGMTKALRSGIFAAYAATDLLQRQDRESLDRYARFVRDEFNQFLNTRRQVYGSETRWPHSPFWHRRQEAPAALPLIPAETPPQNQWKTPSGAAS